MKQQSKDYNNYQKKYMDMGKLTKMTTMMKINFRIVMNK